MQQCSLSLVASFHIIAGTRLWCVVVVGSAHTHTLLLRHISSPLTFLVSSQVLPRLVSYPTAFLSLLDLLFSSSFSSSSTSFSFNSLLHLSSFSCLFFPYHPPLLFLSLSSFPFLPLSLSLLHGNNLLSLTIVNFPNSSTTKTVRSGAVCGVVCIPFVFPSSLLCFSKTHRYKSLVEGGREARRESKSNPR